MNNPGGTHADACTRVRAEAKIKVLNAQAQPYDQATTPSLTEIRISETFSGGLDGESMVRALQVRRDDGSAWAVSKGSLVKAPTARWIIGSIDSGSSKDRRATSR